MVSAEEEAVGGVACFGAVSGGGVVCFLVLDALFSGGHVACFRPLGAESGGGVVCFLPLVGFSGGHTACFLPFGSGGHCFLVLRAGELDSGGGVVSFFADSARGGGGGVVSFFFAFSGCHVACFLVFGAASGGGVACLTDSGGGGVASLGATSGGGVACFLGLTGGGVVSFFPLVTGSGGHDTCFFAFGITPGGGGMASFFAGSRGGVVSFLVLRPISGGGVVSFLAPPLLVPCSSGQVFLVLGADSGCWGAVCCLPLSVACLVVVMADSEVGAVSFFILEPASCGAVEEEDGSFFGLGCSEAALGGTGIS